MTAKLQVINTGLGHIGEAPYESLDVSPVPPKLAKAVAALDGLAGVADWVLRRHPWLCATTYATLNREDRDGGWKFPCVFVLPETCLKLWEVDGCTAYEAGVDVINGASVKVVRSTSEGPLYVAFTERKPLDLLTADVLNVMGYELAARIAGPIQEKSGAAFHKAALELLEMAQGAEAGEHGGNEPLMAGGFAALRLSAG